MTVNYKKYLIKWDKESVSKPQTQVKNFLSKYWQNHIVCEEFRIPGSLLRVDFINFNSYVCIEVSPASVHSTYNSFFHKTAYGYLASLRRDEEKEIWVKRNGFKFVEIYEEDIPNLSKEWFFKKYEVYL